MGEQPDAHVPHLTPKEYWQFQTANSAFMTTHAYHSHYERMSVAASHPGFPLFPEGAPSGPHAHKDTMHRIDENMWRDYEAWKKNRGHPDLSKGPDTPPARIDRTLPRS